MNAATTSLAPLTADDTGRTAEPTSAATDELPTAEDRGSLVILDRVVARVAGYAVTLVDHAIAAPRRVLGVNVGESRPDAAAHVTARVQGASATVTATIAVVWPASVASVAEETRRRVTSDVALMTGVRVDHVDIDVVSMSAPTRAVRRVR